MTGVAVFGLGYVGSVTVAALAAAGHRVIGVDVNPTKVGMIEAGRGPVIEPGLDDLLGDGVRSGQITATTDGVAAISQTNVSILCVGTPSRPNGSLDLSQVAHVSRQIGEGLALSKAHHVIVARSTMLPGSTEEVVIRTVEDASGMKCVEDFGVAYNPEFLREGSSLADYYSPPFTLVGANDEHAASVAAGLYAGIEAELIMTPLRVAEMVKYSSNAFHALKVAFANEIGNICEAQGIDSRQVMRVFARDVKLNLSAAYLMPGFAFGGSCLPKDLRALTYQARSHDVPAPLLDSIMVSNQRQIDRALDLVVGTGKKRIAVLGLSFKAKTDDLRESPMVALVERLIGKGYTVSIFDRNVSLANLQGANRVFIENEIPHIASLLKDSIAGTLAEADVVVVGNGDPEFGPALSELTGSQHVIDLVGLPVVELPAGVRYQGISW
jgi:GDP-mannose 6-dehydrogenase